MKISRQLKWQRSKIAAGHCPSSIFGRPFNAGSLLRYRPFIARQVQNQVNLFPHAIICLWGRQNPSSFAGSYAVIA
jgi:hypothetical protein